MIGNSPVGSMPVGAQATSSAIDPEPEYGIIDSSKVPAERRVVFEGSKRVVSFPGSINKVTF